MPRRSFGAGKVNVLLRATFFGGDKLTSIVDIRVSSLQYFTFLLILSVQKSFYWSYYKQTIDIPFR